MEEIWKDIEGYENLYQISNMGRVSALRYGKVKILKNRVNKGGYSTVILTKNYVPKTFYVHRLVAMHFIPNPENKPHIDHINTDRADNRVENLRWVTNKENHNNALSVLNHSKVNSKINCENYIKAVLKPVIQLTMKGIPIKMYSSCMEAAKYIDTHHTNIRGVLAGKQKSAKGSRWLKYDDFESWY